MTQRQVLSSAHTAASADQAWAVVRDFCAPWHPLIETMEAEAGGTIRRFTMKGEETVYRERLTWFSDSERSLGYTHMQGISGVEHYDGRLTVQPTASGAAITMSAVFSAYPERAPEIAKGTQMIFDLGTARIAELAGQAKVRQQLAPPAASIKPERVEINSLPRLVLSAAGALSDTLVLLLHGIGGNRSNWVQQLAAIAPLTRVAALDLRGYGESSLGPSQSTVDDYCDDILRIMEAMKAKRLILCGLSYGAWIATSFAHRYPENLAGLVVSGGCTGMSEAGPAEREAFRLSREVPMSKGQTPADFAPSVVNVIAGPNASGALRAELRQSMEAIGAKTYGDALRCFTNPLERFDFSKLSMPVLAMSGEYDKLAPPHEIKSVAERIFDAAPEPDVRFEVIPGAGHVCNLEMPSQYNRILSEFVSRVFI
jgi:pimeloyl-ACP methyl ester carboxylesterase